MFDLILRGGHLIDPAAKINAPMDVLLRDGRVAAALAVNRPEDVRVARLIIQHRTEVTEAHLVDVDTSLGELDVSREQSF